MHAFTAGNLASAALVSTRLERILRNAKTPGDIAQAKKLALLVWTLVEHAEHVENMNLRKEETTL